jgi:hypothetical protein
MVAGVVLRFAWLDRWCLWSDELASFQRAAGGSLSDHLGQMRGNHPLYEVAVLRPWTMLTRSDAGIRIPSALAGSLTLLVLWALARKLDGRVAAVAVWLLALSPLHVLFSRLARPYALAALLAVLATWALVQAVQRRRLALPAYVLLAVLLVLTNLFGVALLVAHAVVLVWLYRRRPVLLWRWAAAGVIGAALVAPWLAPNLRPAVQWSQDTPYRAQQMGRAVKALYVPFTFALGETVHPLNAWVVMPSLAVFAPTLLAGVVSAFARRRGALVFLAELLAVWGLGLVFSAADSKHMLIALPAFAVVLATGVSGLRSPRLQTAALAGVLALSGVSLLNYFMGREFHDADMVTPWRQMAGRVEALERAGDRLLVGYRGDQDAFRMFCRYYRGALRPEYVRFADWRAHLGKALVPGKTVWVLLHEGDPRAEMEAWLRGRTAVEAQGFQWEEHTLRGLREGLGSARRYASYLYILYRVTPAGP